MKNLHIITRRPLQGALPAIVIVRVKLLSRAKYTEIRVRGLDGAENCEPMALIHNVTNLFKFLRSTIMLCRIR